MKCLSVFVSCLFFAGFVHSQITFSSKDYPQPGLTIQYYEGRSDSVDLGAVGANKLFDFSRALTNLEDTAELSFVAPSSTPYASQHPGATVAFIEHTEKDSATNKTVLEIWRFVEVSSNASKKIGVTIKVDTAYMFSQAAPTSMEAFHGANSPAEEYVGMNWTFNSISSTTSSWHVTAGPLKHTEITYRDIFIDSWGTFKNPWRSFDAIRFRISETISYSDSVNGNLDDMWVDTNNYFEYWVNGLGHYMARAYTNSDFTNLKYFEMANQRGPVGIEPEVSTVEFNLYPVPAKEILFMEASFDGIVEYSIKDVRGRIVRGGEMTLESGRANQITLNNMDRGFYFLDVRSNGVILGSKKFVIE